MSTIIGTNRKEYSMEQIIKGLADFLFGIEGDLVYFKRDTYKDHFMSLYEEHEHIFKSIEERFSQSDNTELMCGEIAVGFVDEVYKKYDEIQKKSAKEQFVLDHNTLMVVYIFPSILFYKGENLTPLADAIVTEWNARFTKYHIGTATFEEIKGGFKTKLCYITTAVCESLGKPDDCYELQMLRQYRDQYLAAQEDGAMLIDTYYDIAPTIVTRINKCEDAKQIYQDIYQTYLNPCIQTMEQNENEKCKEIYVSMMNCLREEYMGYQA